MNLKYSIKSLIKFILILITFPSILSIVLFLSKKQIYLIFFKDSTIKSRNKFFILHRLIIYLNYYYLPNYLKKKLLNSVMANEIEGVAWANFYLKEKFPYKYFEKVHAYNYVNEFIKNNKDKIINIHQVCASSGREINYFSKFSEKIIFEASDISQAISNNIKSNFSNINCYHLDLSDQKNLEKISKRCSLIIVFGGLQYLLPKDLQNFFKICGRQKCELIIAEPISNLINPYSLKESKPRTNFSWSHAYINYAKDNEYKLKNSNVYNLPNQPKRLSAHFIPK